MTIQGRKETKGVDGDVERNAKGSGTPFGKRVVPWAAPAMLLWASCRYRSCGQKSAFPAVRAREGNNGQRVVEHKPLNRPKPFRPGPVPALALPMLFPKRPLNFPLIARSKFYDWAAPTPPAIVVPSQLP